MHSSQLHTARLLTISQHALWPRGCTCPRGGVPAWGYLPGGCTCLGGVPAQGVVYLPRGYLLGVYLPGGVPAQGVYLLGVYLPGVYLPGGVPAWGGGCLPGRCTCLGQYLPRYSHPPPPCGQTDTCKTITFANFVCGGKNQT